MSKIKRVIKWDLALLRVLIEASGRSHQTIRSDVKYLADALGFDLAKLGKSDTKSLGKAESERSFEKELELVGTVSSELAERRPTYKRQFRL